MKGGQVSDFVKYFPLLYPQREAENIAHLVTEKITRVIHGSIRNNDLSLNDDEIG
ncbi:MAG: hypothetical protein IPH58_16695 [Sphingobacteriales bacterium]|nr:hypothetical protein [Sphingobacteriales bacterium]